MIILLLVTCSVCTPVGQRVNKNTSFSESAPVSSSSQEPMIKTWHHDCSNSSGFEYMEIPTESWDYWWTYTNTSLESDGQSFPMPRFTNTSPVREYYGPVYVCTLPDVFPLSGLRNFSVQMELNNSDPAYYGVVRVGLFGESYSPVLESTIRDWSSFYSRGDCKWKYYIRNWSIHAFALGDERALYYEMGFSGGALEFVNMTWSSWFDPIRGLSGSTSAYGPMSAQNRTIIPIEEAETARDIKYIVLIFGGYYKYRYQPLPPFRVHDIYLEYEVGGVIDTTPPLLTPQLDREYIVGQTGNVITWNCADDHPYRYWLFEKYQDLFLEGGLWNGSSISISIDGLELGNYGFELFLQDKAGFIVADFVKVQVIEDPFIKSLNSFIAANWLTILILSIVGIACILDLRDRRETARRRGDTWARSLQMQTNSSRPSVDQSYE